MEPTRSIALRIWWAFVWRFAVCVLLIAMLQGFVLGLLIAVLRLTASQADAVSGVLTILLGLPLVLAASWECLYRILGTRIGSLELMLMRRDR